MSKVAFGSRFQPTSRFLVLSLRQTQQQSSPTRWNSAYWKQSKTVKGGSWLRSIAGGGSSDNIGMTNSKKRLNSITNSLFLLLVRNTSKASSARCFLMLHDSPPM